MFSFVAVFAIVLLFGAIPLLVISVLRKTSRGDLESEEEALGANEVSESDGRWPENGNAPWDRDGVAPNLRE